MTTATNTTLGEIKLAGDLAGNNNGLAPELTVSGVTPGSYTIPVLTVNSKGIITAAASGTSGDLVGIIPVATATTLGAIKIGTGITMSGGSSEVLNIPFASSSVKGIAAFSTGFLVSGSGEVMINPLDLPIASAGTRGTIRVGTGLSIDSGTGIMSVVLATDSIKGVASFDPAHFTVTAGAVSLVSTTPVATNTTLGTVKSADTNNITIVAGGIDVGANIAKLNSVNVFTKAQISAVSVLVSASNITPDFSLSNVFTLTASTTFTLENPTNVVAGGVYTIIVTQDSIGNRQINWGSNFKFQGFGPSLSTTANAVDIITIVARSSTVLVTQVFRGFV